MVMSARYLAMVIAPEALFTASFLACFQTNPTEKNVADARFLLGYLKFIRDERIIVSALGRDATIRMLADAANHIHRDFKAHGGMSALIGACRCSITEQSAKIKCNAKDSTDAELLQFELATYLGDYLRQVLLEIGIDCEVVYYQDNESALALASSGTVAYDRKRKYMITCINGIHEYLADPSNRARAVSLATGDMVSDILTKDLMGHTFRKHKATLKGGFNPANLPVRPSKIAVRNKLGL
jgi:hypothetical protein